MTTKKIYRGTADVCSICKTEWFMQVHILKDGTEVHNYWCLQCDTLRDR